MADAQQKNSGRREGGASQARQVPSKPADKPLLERAVVLLGAFSQNTLGPKALAELRNLLGSLPRNAQEAAHWKSQLKHHRGLECQMRRVPCAPVPKRLLDRAVILLGAFAQNTLNHESLDELRGLMGFLPANAQEATLWKTQLKRHRKVMYACRERATPI